MTSIKWKAINSEVNSKVYIGSYQEFRFNNWSCFIVTRIIINTRAHAHTYIIKKHDPIHINNPNIYTIYHAYGKLSTYLTQNQTELENTEINPTDVSEVEYQDYLNTKGDILKNDLKRTYNLFNTLN